jgi:hypothetical protein
MARFKRFKTDSSEELAEYLVDSIKEIIYVIEDLHDDRLIDGQEMHDLNNVLDKLVELFTEVSDYDFNLVIETAPLLSNIE